MKRISIQTPLAREDILSALRDAPTVNAGLTFDDREGSPTVHVREGRADRLRLRCYMLGGASRDNGYVQGTFFWGRMRERNGMTYIHGSIMTEPVFHVLWLALIAFFIVTCIQRTALSVVPVCLIVFVYFMFRKEYRKQEYLRRYILRAIHRLEKKNNLR